MQQFLIFVEITGSMLLFNNEPHLVEKIYEGNDQAFSSLYEKYRAKFFGYFKGLCDEERFANQTMMRFKQGGLYLDDLYQQSCLKLYNQIMTGKMFVSGGKIYLTGKDGSINLLKASLETYLTSIGKLTLKELERGERRYVDFDPIERIAHDDNDPGYDIEIECQQVEPSRVNVDPSFELLTDPFFNDEDRFALVRQIVDGMESPCKEIFTYTYFNENGKKLKGEEIAEKMGYASADVVKNQKSRCHKRFKAKYNAEISARL